MAAKSDLPVSDWSPISPEAKADPRAEHARLRAQCPVAHSSEWGGFYTLTKYEDVAQASRDYETFTATKQTVIPTSPRKGLARLPLQKDPPEHTYYRQGMNLFFKENKIRAMEPALRDLATGLWRDWQKQGNPAEYSDGFAARFSQGTICLLVGLDLSEGDELGRLSHEYVHAVQSENLSFAGGHSNLIDQFAIDLVADRRANPRDPETDMVTGLAAAEIQGRKYDDTEIAGMIRLLLIGGHTVPKNFLSSMAWHLAGDVDLQADLRARPEARKAAIEEFLRYYSPNQALVRRTTRATEMRGTKIPQDCPVALNFLSANFDEDVFENPQAFDPARSPNRHLAFGIGPHICIGMSLARMQARIALDLMLDGMGPFTLDGPVQWAGWTEFGVAEVWLRR